MALVHCRGARFSASLAWALLLERRRAVTNHRAFRLPPDASRRQFDRPPLVRFCLFPSAYQAAPCRSKRPCLEPFRCGAFSMPAPTGIRFALAVFIASRFRLMRLVQWKRRPRKSFTAGFLSAAYRARQSGNYRSLSGILRSPATLMGFSFPSQLSSASRVTTPLSVSNPHAVSPCAWPRVSSSRNQAKYGRIIKRLAAAPGFWPRETAVPCDLSAPL